MPRQKEYNAVPIAAVNGIQYYTAEEHQKYIDSIDPDTDIYKAQIENGKTVFNGVDRVVVDPRTMFSVLYHIDSKNKKIQFILDPISVEIKEHSLEVKKTTFQGYEAPFENNEIGKPFVAKSFNREEFLNNFSQNLYDDDPELAISVFKNIFEAPVVKSEKIKIKK